MKKLPRSAVFGLFLLMGAPGFADTKISLPADDAAHSGLTVPGFQQENDEWWYYNGHLLTPSGHRYGFELVFFQLEEEGGLQVAQFAVTDIDGKTFHQNTWLSPGHYPVSADGFNLAVADGPAASRQNGRDHLTASLPDGYSVELDLASLKPAVAEFGDGFVPYLDPSSGIGLGYDYYYSRTRIGVVGTVSVAGHSEPAIGQAWFDHEWGALPQVSWQWYSIQLNNGEEVMAYTLSQTLGSPFIAAGATWVDSAGTAPQYFTADEFTMSSAGAWVSPHTGTTFPTAFKLVVPAKTLTLNLTPVLQDQEVFGDLLNYWEGAVQVSGTESGTPVQGMGYIELLGY